MPLAVMEKNDWGDDGATTFASIDSEERPKTWAPNETNGSAIAIREVATSMPPIVDGDRTTLLSMQHEPSRQHASDF